MKRRQILCTNGLLWIQIDHISQLLLQEGCYQRVHDAKSFFFPLANQLEDSYLLLVSIVKINFSKAAFLFASHWVECGHEALCSKWTNLPPIMRGKPWTFFSAVIAVLRCILIMCDHTLKTQKLVVNSALFSGTGRKCLKAIVHVRRQPEPRLLSATCHVYLRNWSRCWVETHCLLAAGEPRAFTVVINSNDFSRVTWRINNQKPCGAYRTCDFDCWTVKSIQTVLWLIDSFWH